MPEEGRLDEIHAPQLRQHSIPLVSHIPSLINSSTRGSRHQFPVNSQPNVMYCQVNCLHYHQRCPSSSSRSRLMISDQDFFLSPKDHPNTASKLRYNDRNPPLRFRKAPNERMPLPNFQLCLSKSTFHSKSTQLPHTEREREMKGCV